MRRLIYSCSIVLSLIFCEYAFSQTPVQPPGSGTMGDPYQVGTLSNLAWIQDVANDTAWNSYYVQTADIDASSDSTWNSHYGFAPIGFYPGVYFGGTYDGGGHTITGLYISKVDSNYDGLFGYTQGATILNLGLINVNVTGGTAVGGLGGEFYGNTVVRNCYVTGNVSGGGLVGGLIGWTETSSSVIHSYSHASVSASLGPVGGLVGWNDFSAIDSCYSTAVVSAEPGCGGPVGGFVGESSSSTITHSHSTASVSAPGTGTSYIGGFVGQSYPTDTISTCYSNGTVTSNGSIIGGFSGYNVTSLTTDCYSTTTLVCASSCDWVGGFVGQIQNSTDSNCYSTSNATGSVFVGGYSAEIMNSAVVSKCYSVGHVSGSALAGGFTGYVNSSTVDSSFWDMDSSGWSTSAGGEGKTDAEMKTGSTFTNALWDFSGTWAINVAVNSGYPYLIGTTDISLPVQATGFTATAAAGSISLSWRTQSEVNNAGFVVMREQSGINGWQLAGSYVTDKNLEGLGTSSSGRSYSFTDDKVISGKTYNYKIQSVSTDGTTKDLSTLTVTVDVPKSYALYQNYPNPFNPGTTVSFDLKKTSTVAIDIYNTLGQRVEELNYGTLTSGRYSESINMSRFASGVYFYRIVAQGIDNERFVSMKKLVLLK
ncbi:MAG TPA: T9SS type A sorting domain-containing protein [Candidatus Kryptonia bacterium]